MPKKQPPILIQGNFKKIGVHKSNKKNICPIIKIYDEYDDDEYDDDDNNNETESIGITGKQSTELQLFLKHFKNHLLQEKRHLHKRYK